MSKEFSVGDKVRVIALPAYVKTAESMPMLRPPNVIRLGEEGTVLGRQPGNYWSVRLERGAYLLDSEYLERVNPAGSAPKDDDCDPQPMPEADAAPGP